jgi:hypothetical protein
MPTFDFTSPDGQKYSIDGPEGATRDQAFQMLQLRIAHEKQDAPAASLGDTAADVAKQSVAGPVSGVVDAATAIPRLTAAAKAAANKYLFDPMFNAISGPPKAGPQPLDPSAAVAQAGDTFNNNVLPQAQTPAGQLTRTVGSNAINMIGGAEGIPLKMLTRMLLPGAASEAAGAATEGTAAQPWAKAVGSLVGGGLGGAIEGSRAATALLPKTTLAEVDAATKAGYANPELQGLKLQAQPVSQLGDAIKNDLENTHGMFRDDHTGVYADLDRLSSKTNPVSFPELDAIRKSLGNKANEVGPTGRATEQAAAAIKAKNHLDNFIDQIGVTNPAPIAVGNGFTLPNPTIASGNPAAAVAALKTARANAGAAIRSREVQSRINDALVGANVVNSGDNAQNRIRQALAPYLKKGETKMNSFTPEEQAAMRSTVLGSTPLNVLRRASNLMPSSGGLATMVGIGGHMAAGMPGAAIPVAGFALKKLANAATKSQAQSVADMLLERAPAAQPTISANKAIKMANEAAMRRKALGGTLRGLATSLLNQ